MWTVALFAGGIILVVFGALKRKTDWGKPVAVVGVIAIGVSMFVGGPDALDSFLRGFNGAYNPDVPADTVSQ